MNSDVVVLTFASGVPRALRGLTVTVPDDTDTALAAARRVVVVGGDADLASVLTRLMRAELLGVEVAYVPRRRTPATRAYRLPSGRRAARRALGGSVHRVPLIRDETGSVIAGRAVWRPTDDEPLLHGEAVVDDAVLFDGEVRGVTVEPTAALPGLRARVSGTRRWLVGRAAQLGGPGVMVVRDGVPGSRAARRSTIYRNTEGWLAVR
ncbi:peptidase M50 [Mycobacterium sp.]|uniref:peptidase M50 n=1 Tax=Mycobacterium sp. TaxID=1785 RepID=UPI0025EC0AAD|nr:peptidase M50 [Mycobacterium sp.]